MSSVRLPLLNLRNTSLSLSTHLRDNIATLVSRFVSYKTKTQNDTFTTPTCVRVAAHSRVPRFCVCFVSVYKCREDEVNSFHARANIIERVVKPAS